MRISDWSSDVCSSDLLAFLFSLLTPFHLALHGEAAIGIDHPEVGTLRRFIGCAADRKRLGIEDRPLGAEGKPRGARLGQVPAQQADHQRRQQRSEEHMSELQSLMRISNAVFCLKKKETT